MADALISPLAVVAFGVSTPFAYWGFDAVREVVRALAGETLHLHLTNLQAMRDGFAARGRASVVVTADLPDPELVGFLRQSGLPIIAFGDSIDDMIDWTARSRSCSIARATRFTSQVLSGLTPAFLTPNILILGPQTPPREIVRAIVAYLAPKAGSEVADQLFQDLTRDGWLAPGGPADWRAEPAPTPPPEAGLSSEPDALIATRGSLEGYAAIFRGAAPERIVWPLSLFHCPSAKNWRGPIDLTGPARAVIYGPYLHLPVGSWIVRVEFEIDGAVSGVEAATDVVTTEVVVEKLFDMPEKGIFAYELAFGVVDPHRPIEIRLFTKRSAIEGLLLVRSVVVRPG